MEWHLVHTICASVLAVWGLALDGQSFIGGLRFWRKGAGPRPTYLYPLAAYLAGAAICDGNAGFKEICMVAGLVIHLMATVGIRWLGIFWSRHHSKATTDA